MNSKPLISVVIIFLNAEKFIKEAIESVFTQTYDNWELLLVDDGSTDKSTQVAKSYANQHRGKVHYLEHDGHINRGMSASRNLGIRKSKGTYIAFLDADDVWFPNKLEEQLKILLSYPEVSLVFGVIEYWYSWAEKTDDSKKDYIPHREIPNNAVIKPPELLTLLYPLGKSRPPGISNFIMRRDMLERIGGFEEKFDGKYQMYEDQAFLAKVYLKEQVYVSGQCWARYRIHPDQFTVKAVKVGEYDSVRFYYLKWLKDYLYKQNFKNPEICNALNQALLHYRNPVLRLILKYTGILLNKKNKF